MSWDELLAQRRVEKKAAARNEIRDLRALVMRELSDARVVGVSLEGRFEHAYMAGRAIAVMVIRAAGYRLTSGPGGHYSTFIALECADQPAFGRFALYLQRCRAKRNEMSYVHAEVITETEVDEIMRLVPEFQMKAESWIKRKHPTFST